MRALKRDYVRVSAELHARSMLKQLTGWIARDNTPTRTAPWTTSPRAGLSQTPAGDAFAPRGVGGQYPGTLKSVRNERLAPFAVLRRMSPSCLLADQDGPRTVPMGWGSYPMRTRTICLSLLLMSTAASTASAQALGASVAAVKRAYPAAASVRIGRARALELADVDYAGVHWSKVDFVFDATGRLDRMVMNSSAIAYEAALKLAQLQMDAPGPASGLETASEDASPDMEIRVCEGDSGAVTMTFEHVTTLS